MKEIVVLLVLLAIGLVAMAFLRPEEMAEDTTSRLEIRQIDEAEEWEVVKCTPVDKIGNDTILVLQTMVRKHWK